MIARNGRHDLQDKKIILFIMPRLWRDHVYPVFLLSMEIQMGPPKDASSFGGLYCRFTFELSLGRECHRLQFAVGLEG
jgi:hypothetical protein